jgi:hypothetical protein
LALGRKAATYDHRDLHFAHYTTTVLPPVPPVFGHDNLIPGDGWGMLGNDSVGDCVFAGAAHETMLWAAEHQLPAPMDAATVLGDYSAVTGYNPANPATDQGTDVRQAMAYRRNTGIADATGKRHRISAYLALEPGNYTQLLEACYLFGAVGVGINFPSSAMDQFNKGRTWSVVHGAHIEGGHYIPVVAHRGTIRLVTWGREIGMTRGFYAKYCEEAWAILSPEHFDPTTGKSPEGFDGQQLAADLAAL